MINSLQNYYLSGVENNIGFLISILNDKKFKKGHLSTNFIKDKFKIGYKSEMGITEEVARNISIASASVLIKQLKKIDLSKSNEFTVKIFEQYINLKIEEISCSDQGNLISGKIKNTKFIFNSNWKLNQKILIAEIDKNKKYFKVNKIQNFHQVNIEHLGIKADVKIFPSHQKNYYEFMPKISNEDLSKKLISPMPGLVKTIQLEKNQKVKLGDQLIIIEAMKMENILRSEKDCFIDKVLVKEGDSVSTNQELILFKNQK